MKNQAVAEVKAREYQKMSFLSAARFHQNLTEARPKQVIKQEKLDHQLEKLNPVPEMPEIKQVRASPKATTA